jgi:hypothetical protein
MSADSYEQPDPPLQPWHCGAKKRNGKPCRGSKMPNGRCRIHGGLSPPAGPGHPGWKTGAHSKSFGAHLPPRMQERFEQALNDPQLLSLRKYVAYYDTKVRESLDRYQALDSGDYRKRLLTAWTSFKAVNAEKTETQEEADRKRERAGALIAEIDQLISIGADQEEALAEIDKAIASCVNVTNAEQRRLIESGQSLSLVEAMGLVTNLHRILSEEIADKALLSRIAARIRQATNVSGSAASAVGAASAERLTGPAAGPPPSADAGSVIDVESKPAGGSGS